MPLGMAESATPSERAQERAEHGLGVDRGRSGALQVDVELAVGKPVGGGVRHVDGEGRLADTADARDGGDRHHRPVGLRQFVAEFGHEGGPAGEIGHGRRELRRPGGLGAGCGRVLGRLVGQLVVGLQDALLEFGQLGARVDAEFVGEQLAGVGVDGQCLGLPSAAVESEHQQLPQPLAERVRGGERGQFADGLGVAADLEVEVEPQLQQAEPPFAEPDALVFGVGARDVGERFAGPLGERGTVQLAGRFTVTRRGRFLGTHGEFVRLLRVQRGLGAGADGIAAGFADQDPGGGAESFADARGVGAQRGLGPLGRVLAPDGVDELLGGAGAAAGQQQRRQQRLLLG